MNKRQAKKEAFENARTIGDLRSLISAARQRTGTFFEHDCQYKIADFCKAESRKLWKKWAKRRT